MKKELLRSITIHRSPQNMQKHLGLYTTCRRFGTLFTRCHLSLFVAISSWEGVVHTFHNMIQILNPIWFHLHVEPVILKHIDVRVLSSYGHTVDHHSPVFGLMK